MDANVAGAGKNYWADAGIAYVRRLMAASIARPGDCPQTSHSTALLHIRAKPRCAQSHVNLFLPRFRATRLQVQRATKRIVYQRGTRNKRRCRISFTAALSQQTTTTVCPTHIPNQHPAIKCTIGSRITRENLATETNLSCLCHANAFRSSKKNLGT
jgi:hypothetical protein